MKKDNFKKGEIIIYKTSKNEVDLDVRLEEETVWLNLNQLSILFDTDKSGISRHIKNIYKDEELDKKATVAIFATVFLRSGFFSLLNAGTYFIRTPSNWGYVSISCNTFVFGVIINCSFSIVISCKIKFFDLLQVFYTLKHREKLQEFPDILPYHFA